MPAMVPAKVEVPEKSLDPDADPTRIAQARRIAEIHADLERLTVPVPDRDLLAAAAADEDDDEADEAEVDADEAADDEADADDEVDADEPEDASADEQEAESEENEVPPEEGAQPEPATDSQLPVQARPDDRDADEADPQEDRTLIGVTLKRKLFVTVSDNAPVEVTSERFIIGRDAKCDLVVNSDKLSRQHAAVILDATGAELEDLGSSNGTWYDERRITRRDIDDGDEFHLGDVRLKFEFRG